jgi:lysozyme
VNWQRLKGEIRREEGWRGTAYKDSLGYWTIGYGFLVDARKSDSLPLAVADVWLDYKLQDKIASLDQHLPWWKTQPEEVQEALVNMVYQLGVNGLLKFKTTLSRLEKGDREGAAESALKSLWAKQTPERAKRVTDKIRGTSGP